MDRCVKVEHARFHGGLHLAGFDTGVITSRRRAEPSRAPRGARTPAGNVREPQRCAWRCAATGVAPVAATAAAGY